MIKAIVFDCFGVLVTEGWIPFRDEYFGTDGVKLHEANALMRQLVTGQLADNEFRKSVALLAGVTPEEVRDHMNDNVPDVELFSYISTLKSRYKVAMLSNVGKNRLKEIFTPEQVALFNIFALSSETGYAKPGAMAYRNVANSLEVTTEQCVFVDDQPHNLEGARAVGMLTVLFQSVEQCIADVGALLANS